MSALVLRGDAARLPIPDASVDLIVTSPPYFALRSYRDGGDHYAGQLGSEPTPQAFLEALWTVMAECWRVLKPTGSCFVNLGDKRSGSGGHNNSGLGTGNLGPDRMRSSTLSGGKKRSLAAHMDGDLLREVHATRRNAPDRYNQAAFGRPKSKMLLPHRFAIGCEDGLADPDGVGWIVRSDLVWQKVNGLPESVTDRCRDSHEYVFHLTKQGRYFAAVDEVREPHAPNTAARTAAGFNSTGRVASGDFNNGMQRSIQAAGETYAYDINPLGKLPGSVWPLASEPLRISPEIQAGYNLPDHFAAFPSELVRRIILGWSPSGVCVGCGEGRRPVVDKKLRPTGVTSGKPKVSDLSEYGNARGWNGEGYQQAVTEATITGYSCPCGDPAPPTKPSVVCDPFSGTGTVAGVARALGRTGVGVDLSADYCRLGRYFIFNSNRFAKATARTNGERQGSML